MLVRIYKFILQNKNEKELIICGAIAKHNGYWSTNYNSFVSKVTEQIMSLVKTQDVDVDILPTILQNILRTFTHNDGLEFENLYLHFNLKCELMLININSNSSIFFSKYIENIRITRRYDSYVSAWIQKIDKLNYISYEDNSLSQTLNRRGSIYKKIYDDNNVQLYKSNIPTFLTGSTIYWKIILDFPLQKRWHADCLVICDK